ncbi:MAG: histidine kinase [Bacteroidota bacterium]
MTTNFNILYVDDEPDNLLAFKAIFRRHYHVFTAQGGLAALALLEEQPIDLIISDQRMPKMNGVELLEKVRITHPEMIRMVLTGYSDVQAIIDAINKGKVDRYITKPWNVEELKIIISTALESYNLRKQNKQLREERNALMLKSAQQEKENILAQYEILRNQINPHFLFNSMNILSSLISTNPKQAITFTQKFSKIYRSLLELRDQQIISLEQELNFIRSYIFLQKMRFDENLRVDIQVAEEKMAYCLPPFSLQLLVENAIKHNVVSLDNPLNITIHCEGHYAVVTNNLQPRGNAPSSTKVGLSNLQARYRLITPEPVVFEQTNKEYIAKIPLIEEG